MSYRLIVHSTVYYDYDNSSVLLNDNICTLSNFEFYLFSKYITILKKQPSKRIRLADYLSDNSMPHDIVVIHMVNNIFTDTILTCFFMKKRSKLGQFFYFFINCINKFFFSSFICFLRYVQIVYYFPFIFAFPKFFFKYVI